MTTPISSSSPKVQLGKHKAVIAAVVSAIGAGASALTVALSDGAIDLAEAWTIIGAILAGGGLTGGLTYVQPTTVKVVDGVSEAPDAI
jgi:hypothetical protein